MGYQTQMKRIGEVEGGSETTTLNAILWIQTPKQKWKIDELLQYTLRR